jgi:Flp pilus assembly protein TadG
MKIPENPHPTESGQSLVELAMSLMFLFILVAGAVDLGRAFFTYIALRDAAQEGAAYASIARSSQAEEMKCSDIVTRAKGTSTTQIVNLADTSVSILLDGVPCATGLSNSRACYGRAVEVIVHYADFRLTTPLLGTIIGSQTVPITASIIDTVLTPSCH